MLELFNMLDWFMLVVGAFFVARGLGRGFIGELGSLVALFVAIVGSVSLYQPVADFLRRVVGKPDFWWETLAFIICFIVLHMFIMFVASRMSKVLYKSSLSFINRLLGAALGLLKAAILCYVVVNLLLMAHPYARNLDNEYLQEDWVNRSYLAPSLLKFGNSMISIISDEFAVKIPQNPADVQLTPPGPSSPPVELNKPQNQ